jgi:putative transposase
MWASTGPGVVGLNSFAMLSDGVEIDNPRQLERGLAHLQRCQRKLARRKRAVIAGRKLVCWWPKAHRKIRNQRVAFHHDVSRWLVNRSGVIAVEDLNIKGLSSGMLARSVNDAGWNSFFSKIAYKAECAGREMVKLDPRGTSQICLCGASVAKTLQERWHECPAFRVSVLPDVASAQVLLQRARIGRAWHNVGYVVSCVPREAVAFQATE